MYPSARDVCIANTVHSQIIQICNYEQTVVIERYLYTVTECWRLCSHEQCMITDTDCIGSITFTIKSWPGLHMNVSSTTSPTSSMCMMWHSMVCLAWKCHQNLSTSILTGKRILSFKESRNERLTKVWHACNVSTVWPTTIFLAHMHTKASLWVSCGVVVFSVAMQYVLVSKILLVLKPVPAWGSIPSNWTYSQRRQYFVFTCNF